MGAKGQEQAMRKMKKAEGHELVLSDKRQGQEIGVIKRVSWKETLATLF